MAGPGGQEIGRLSVRVVHDSALLGPSLLRDLEAIERSTELHIRAVLDDTGLAADARRLAATAERAATVPVELEADRVDAEFQRIIRGFAGESVNLRVNIDQRDLDMLVARGRQFAQLASISVAIGGVASATTGLVGLAVGAVDAAGALLLLPAAGFAATAAIATLVVGMQGFGDALSSMDDPAAFAEALANLAPSAAATATAIRDLRPAFQGLRLDVQERLFAGLANTITGLAGTYLPVLRTGLGGIARELNTGARSFATFLSSSQSVADTSAIFADIRAALAQLAPAGVAVAAALRDITTVGASFLPGLAGGLADAAERFRAFIAEARASGDLAGWIQDGITAVGHLLTILRNLGSIVGSVFGAFDTSGGGFLAFLAEATGRLADFLDSAQGAEVLGAVAQFAATAGRAINTVLSTALEEIGPILAALAPGVSVFVTQLGGALVTALRIAGPLLAQFASFLSANASWLAPLVVGLGTLAAVAVPLISGLTLLANTVRVVTTVFNLLKIALLANPFTAIIAGIGALVAAFIWLWNESESFRNFWAGLWDGIVSATQWAIGFVMDIWNGLVWFFQNTTLGKTIVAIFDAIGWAIGKVVDAVKWLIDRIKEAIDYAKNLAGDIIGLSGGGQFGKGNRAESFNNVRSLGGPVRASSLSVDITSPAKAMHRLGETTAQGISKGFAYGIRDATPLAARAANRLANTATFDPVHTDFGATSPGAGPTVSVQQTINAAPEQSPWAIATAANRQLGYALRTGGTP